MAERTMRIYGALDLIFAWIYLLAFIYAVPPYSEAVKLGVYALCITLMVGGVGLILARRWGYWLGVAAAGVLGAVCVFAVLTLVAAAAYLHGLYGAFGKGATYVTLFAISVIVAYMGLLPAFQLHGLLRKDVRRQFVATTGPAVPGRKPDVEAESGAKTEDKGRDKDKGSEG